MNITDLILICKGYNLDYINKSRMELMDLINDFEKSKNFDEYCIKMYNENSSLSIPLMNWKTLEENNSYLLYLKNRYSGFYKSIQLIKNKKIIYEEKI